MADVAGIDPDGEAFGFEWRVTEGEEYHLTHDDERVTALTPYRAVEYEVEVTVYQGPTELGATTVTVDVEHRPLVALDGTEKELLERFAPVFHFHDDEQFVPTRYEAFVENADLMWWTSSGRHSHVERLLETVTTLDLTAESATEFLVPHGDDRDDYEAHQNDRDSYPRTVYGSVHEDVTYDGTSYTALAYLAFYVHDPKPRGVSDLEVPPLFAHTGDQERILLLVDEQGDPQWVGAGQHFGGELRRWEQVETSGDRVHVYPGLGAHSAFLEPGDYLPQLQYFPGQSLAIVAAVPRTLSYVDEARSHRIWTYRASDVSGDEAYELAVLTGNETWAGWDGRLYTYPRLPRLGGRIPMQDETWGGSVEDWKAGAGIADWFETTLVAHHEQADAEIVAPTGDPEVVRDPGDEMIVHLANVGPVPSEFVLDVRAEASDTDERHRTERTVRLDTGAIGAWAEGVIGIAPSGEFVDVPVVPPDAAGTWDVTLELWNFPPDARSIPEDRQDSVALTVDIEPSVGASVAFETLPDGPFDPGEAVVSTVEVTAADHNGTDRTFFVGYGARTPDGEYLDGGGTTGRSVTLEPGSSRAVELAWTVPEDAIAGVYDLGTAVWAESDRDHLRTRLDQQTVPGAVTVPPRPELVDVEVDPSSPRRGESVEVTAIARTTGAPAERQSLAMGFPALDETDDVEIVRHDLDDATVLDAGTTAGADYGTSQRRLTYPLVEGEKEPWTPADGERRLTVAVPTPDDGEFPVEVKAVARGYRATVWAGDPVPGETGHRDQQGEEVRRIDVAPDAPPPGDGSWPMFQFDPANTGYAPDVDRGGETVTETWRFEAGGRVTSSPVVAEGTVYVGSDDGSVHAVNTADGSQQWKRSFGSANAGSPALLDDTLYVGLGNNPWSVYALDRETGELRWSFELNNYPLALTVSEGTVYAAGERDRVVALAADDGRELWSVSPGVGPYFGPAVGEDAIFVSGRNLYAFDPETGDRRWTYETAGSVGCAPAVHDGVVYVGDQHEGRLYAVDAGTGGERWISEETGPVVGPSPAVTDTTLYAGNGKLRAHSLETGDEQWFVSLGPVLSSPVVAAGTVYYGTTHHLQAADAESGELLWRYPVEARVYSTPAVIDGTVFAGSGDGYLYALSHDDRT